LLSRPSLTVVSVSSDSGEIVHKPGYSATLAHTPSSDAGHPIRFEHLTVEHGLSQSTVTSILQDPKGFVWFATWEGLDKFDGYEFTVFRHDPDNAHSLSDNFIWTLFEEPVGVLWVGTENGLNRFDRDNERFVRFQHDPDDVDSMRHNSVRQILDFSGTLWVATAGGGLNRTDRETG
jgi:ligand-binding sensor domain-containing protein